MFCQNCGMLKINCICKKYNESDMNGNENHELNEEAKMAASDKKRRNLFQV